MSGLSSVMQGLTAAVLFGTGARMVLRPEGYRDEGRQGNERAVADRLARGQDRYFEELRTLKAYSQPGPVRTVRVFGWFLVLVSAAQLLSIFFS